MFCEWLFLSMILKNIVLVFSIYVLKCLCYKFNISFYCFQKLWNFIFINFQRIDIEARCPGRSLKKFLANFLSYPKKEEEEPLLRLRLQVTNNNLVIGDYQMHLWIDKIDNVLKQVLWMKPSYIGCTLILLQVRM